MCFGIVLGIILVLVYILYTSRGTKITVDDKEPPILSGYLPILGHIHLLIGGNNRIINVIKNGSKESIKNGDAVSFCMGPLLIYVITDPDDCLTVANSCLQSTYSFAKEVFGNGLLTCPASIWKRHRKLINMTFNQHILDEFMPIFNKQAKRLVDEFRIYLGKGPFDNLPYLRRNTLQTINLTAMGLDVEKQKEINQSYLESFDRILGVFVERFMKPWLHIDFIYKFSELKQRQQKYLKDFHRMSATVLKRKKEQLKLHQGVKKNTFIDMLLDNGGFTDIEIKDEVDTFMAAGHETIATLLVFILVLIGSFPDVQERIVMEFNEELRQNSRIEDLSRQDLCGLYYLEAVIKETLRYYSLVPFILRELDRDVKIKNYTLRAGRPCMLLLYALHRHPMWQNADEFRPERWLNPATLPRHPAAFAGFSIGKRNCIGQNFAMMSIKTIIVHLLRHYHIKSDHTKLQLKVDFVFRAAEGYHISLKPRN